MSRLSWQTMVVGPSESATQIVGDREAIDLLASALTCSTADGVSNLTIDTGNGSHVFVHVRCVDPKPGN
jgi:hypothetical protein